MKLFPSPPTVRFFILLTTLLLVGGAAIDRWLGQSWFGYFGLGVGIVLWVSDKIRERGRHRRSPGTLADAYLDDQQRIAQTLPIRDIFGDDCLPQGCAELCLADVYVPMDVSEADADKINHPDFRRLSFLRESERAVPVVKALADGIAKANGGLRAVLVGEAGGGKSSVVGDLIRGCRQAQPPGDWPEALRDRTVLRFDLRRLASRTDEPAGGRSATKPFWRALREHLCERLDGLDPARDREGPEVYAAVAALREGLQRRGLLLLDGLDEVLDPEQRRRVRDLVDGLGRELGPGCALLVTARPYVYPDAALAGFAVWQLQPLGVGAPGESSQAERLARNWYRALGAHEDDARALIAALTAEPARAELATRPLLLTLLIALSLARRGQPHPLPTDRAGLLEEATTLFVRRWFERIEIDGPGQLPLALLEALTEGRLREVLQRVSREAQDGRHDGVPQAAGGGAEVQIEVWQSQFLGALFNALPKELKAQTDAVERLVLERAGLLFPRGRGDGDARYGYVHRQFQEYLAACELVEREAGRLEERLGTALCASPGAWREVTRFAVVRLARTHGAAEAIALVRALLGGADDPEPADDARYQAAAAGGLALADLETALSGERLTDRQRRDLADAKALLEGWLSRLTEDPTPAPRTRLELGRIAGRLGDPRPGVVPADWTPDAARPFRLDPERDFAWVRIPAGDFTPGSDPGDPQAYEDEQGGTQVPMEGFRISRYPVTQGQFAAFVRAGGYGGKDDIDPPPWWGFSKEAESWWRGGNPGLEQLLADPDYPEENKRAYREWVERRGRDGRRGPWFHGDPAYADWVLPNHPVIGVSWFEAMAFCGWLTDDLNKRGLSERICLPTEIQWERAARGAERRRWPWGDAWREGAANTEESKLGATSAVGLFPAQPADSPCDMAGNVWEWTLTRWGPRVGKPAYGWGPDMKDGRDDPGGADLRVMRGGSWYNTSRFCRGAFRVRDFPNYWFLTQGFRVVRVSLAHSDS